MKSISNTISGGTSNKEIQFSEAQTRENITSGESLQTLFGKIKKWFTDLPNLFVSKSGDTMSGSLTIDKGDSSTSPTTSDLALGNNIPSGTAGTTRGRLHLWGSGSNRTILRAYNSTADRTIDFPDKSGTVALTSDIVFTAVTPTFNTTVVSMNTLTGFTLKLGNYLLVNYTFATNADSTGDDTIINFGSSNLAKYVSYVLLHPLGNSNSGPAFMAMSANTSYYYVYTSYPLKQSTWYQINAIVEIK